MNIADVLKELGNQMGLPNLKLDENRVCRLIFDKKWVIDIEESDDGKTVYLYSAICIIPPRDKENLYEALLEANLFGRGTGGAAFGIDLEMGEILLSQKLNMEKLDYQDFVNILESFVNHVEAWSQKIDTGEYAHEKNRKASETKPSPKEPKAAAKGHEGPPPGFIRA